MKNKKFLFLAVVLVFLTAVSVTSVFSEENEEIIVDTESSDTEGIIILNPGETEPEELERYIISKRRDETKQEQREEIDYGEESELSIDYEADEDAAIMVVDDSGEGTIEKAGYVTVERAGFISENFKEDGSMYSLDNRIYLKQGDEIYVKITVGRGVKPGYSFIIYNDDTEIYSPLDDRYFGRLIDVKAVAKIERKIKEKENLYLAKIVKSYGLVEDDDKVKMRNDVKDYHRKISKKKRKKNLDEKGHIIKIKDDKKLVVRKDIVYMDLGLDNGILPGERMKIYRDTESDSGEEMDSYHEIGTLLVINSMKESSVGMIISQKEIIEPGFSIRTVK